MVEIKSISFTDWVYNTYLRNHGTINRSKYVEEMFVKGCESEITSIEQNKAKIISLLKKNRGLEEELTKLRSELGRIKSRDSKRDPEREAAERIIDGLKANNPLA